jgi:hypothetical protein
MIYALYALTSDEIAIVEVEATIDKELAAE